MTSARSPRRRLAALLPVVVMFIAAAAGPQAAAAHPLDQYIVDSSLTVHDTSVTVDLRLSPGVLIAPAVLPGIDTDDNAEVSAQELSTYVASVAAHVHLSLDGTDLPLAVGEVQASSYVILQSGYGTIDATLEAALPASLGAGAHELGFMNDFSPAGATRQIDLLLDGAATVGLGTPTRDATQTSMVLPLTVAGGATVGSDTTSTSTSAVGGSTQPAAQLVAALEDPALGPLGMLLALLIAALLGGLHALTPGHGKTLAAAYLVGSRGTVRHAAGLGAAITFTHTASVIAIGVLALVASSLLVPTVLVPALEIGSGLLVAVIGGRLAWRRWRGVRGAAEGAAAHDNDRDHAHDGHAHDHETVHDHGDGKPHSHALPDRPTVRNLLAMGVAGGIVPCPEALGILVIAIGLNRIGLGLGLILAFSIGLAAVLVGIGILLVRARPLVDRLGSRGRTRAWSRLVPLASAVAVTALGAGIVVSGVATVLRA